MNILLSTLVGLSLFLFPQQSLSASTFIFPTPPPIPTIQAAPTSSFAPCFPFCGNKPTPTGTPTPTIFPTSTPTPTSGVIVTPTPTTGATVTPIVTPTATPTSTGQIYQGAFTGGSPVDLSGITSFETDAQHPVSIVMWYQAWGNTDGTQNFETAWMNTVRGHGSIPMITWEPWNYSFGTTQPSYTLSRITSGAFDTYITQFAQAAKSWGHPFFLRFAHEMNGNWYPWDEGINQNQPGDYVKAFKHVHDIFVTQGATNVTWVWCPNVTYQGSTSLSELFPGDSYVDWTCMDGYNWGNMNGGWQDFGTLFTTTYNQVVALSAKPVMIGETASSEIGGSKASWITNAYGTGLSSLPQVKAIIWFNQNKEENWTIESSSTSLQAFQQAIKQGRYTSNTYSTLNTSPIPTP